jgi:hypothetical protein
VELYLHFPIRFHGVVLSEAQGQLYLYLYVPLSQIVRQGVMGGVCIIWTVEETTDGVQSIDLQLPTKIQGQ